MKKSLISLVLLLTTVIFTGCENASSAVDNRAVENKNVASDQANVNAETAADKLEIYYFHRTARCRSCNTAGEYISGLMATKYKSQIEDGRIVFAELNVEAPENQEIAQKFQASGSSLFINRIIKGQDNIEQEANIWRLLSDEAKFKQYLSDKINSYLNI